MADIVRYVNTASTSGGDGTTNATTGANRAYPTLAAWNSAEVTNLTTAGNTHTVICEGSTLNDGIDLSAWTTDATNRLTIKTVKGAGRHPGNASSGFAIQTTGFVPCFQIDDSVKGLTIEGIIFKVGASNPQEGFRAPAGTYTGCDIRILRNIFVGVAGWNFQGIDIESSTGGTWRIGLNIFYDIPRASAVHFGNSGTLYLYRNGAFNCLTDSSFDQVYRRSGSGTVVAKGNWAYTASFSTNAAFGGTFDSSSEYNASSDTTAPGTNAFHSISQPTFVDVTNRNLLLASGDTQLKDRLDVDLRSDANFAIDKDILENNVPATDADIGAHDEGATSSTAVIVPSDVEVQFFSEPLAFPIG